MLVPNRPIFLNRPGESGFPASTRLRFLLLELYASLLQRVDLAEVGVSDPVNVVVPQSGVDVWSSSFLVDALENGLRKLN